MKILRKEVGETPLSCIKRCLPDGEVYTYAGRLDPMASGALLVLEGEECKYRDRFLSLTKRYRYTALLGMETDSHDLLGLITRYGEKGEIPRLITGKHIQTIPLFSSKPVDGKPLFQYGIEGEPVELPKNEIEIFEHKLIEKGECRVSDVAAYAIKSVKKVKGDFRIKEIVSQWEEYLQSDKMIKYIKADITCSSGTYIRSLVSGYKGVLYYLDRYALGEYTLD